MVNGGRLLASAVAVYALVSSTIAFPGHLTKFINNNSGFGKYSFEYETSDGTFRREDGGLVPGAGGDTLVVRGEYGYIDTNGRQYIVHYVADANGYRPQSLDDEARFNDRRIV